MKFRTKNELIFIITTAALVYLLSAIFDTLETIIDYLQTHEMWEIDEIIVVSVYLMFAFLFFAILRWRESAVAKQELMLKNARLEEALNEVRALREIVPICAWCKEIRDDEGYWHQLEAYMKKHVGVRFSHGICPDCMDKWRSEAETGHTSIE